MGAIFAAMLIATPIAHAGPPASYFWKGGDGLWDTTSVFWSSSDADGPFNEALGSHTTVYFGGGRNPSLATGIVTLTYDFTGTFIGSDGGTFLLDGHTLNVVGDFVASDVTFDFGGGASSLLTAVPRGDFGSQLTFTDFVSGSDLIRIGTSPSALGPGELEKIVFVGYSAGGAAQIDVNGYVTPVGTLTAVPEPSTYAAIVGALALGLSIWRRSRRTEAVIVR